MSNRSSADPCAGDPTPTPGRTLHRALVDTLIDTGVAPASPPAPIVVAFSGGPDSTALLALLAEVGPTLGLHPVAAHFDHALDPDSARRAAASARLAERLQLPFVVERRDGPSPRGRGIEAAARALRYDFLESQRRALGAAAIAVAHTRDDQLETVVQRLLSGSGVRGVAGMAERRGRIVRPLLRIDRAAAAAGVAQRGLRAVDDPTNADLRSQRSLVRHRLLPRLRGAEPDLDAAIERLAQRAAAAWRKAVRGVLEVAPLVRSDGRIGVARRDLMALPPVLRPVLLGELHRAAGSDYPPRRVALRELTRQLARPAVGVDCGDGWRWRGDSRRLWLDRAAPQTPFFAYTLHVPGEISIAEIAASVRVRREPVKPWMFRGSANRAAFALPLKDGDPVVLRNRRSGDRLTPLGCDYERRLKEILIDHKVPRSERSRLPLLCLGDEGDRVVWVPGVTIEHRFRLTDGAIAWTAEITPR